MAHIPELIIDLALILIVAAITTIIFKRLKQPVVLGYIMAGMLVQPQIKFIPTIHDSTSISIWAEIGIIFILFNLGLDFSIKKLAKLGSVVGPSGLFETSMMMAIGYIVGAALGWPLMDRIFLGGMIAISSTTIILRAFDELKLKTQKFTDLVKGVLILEDMIGVLLLVMLSTIAVSKSFEGKELIASIVQLALFLSLTFVVGIYMIPTLLNRVSKFLDDETILIVSMGLCLAMVVFASASGFSSALGAFLMGSILSETNFVERIEHQINSIKDLFGAIFFVSVGMMINPTLLWENIIPVIILTITVVLGKVICVTTGMLIAGQPLKPSLKSGMSMGQIGEFSFIIATLGMSLGVISNFMYPIAVGVSAITTFLSPYMIRFSEPTYDFIERKLPAKWLDVINSYSNTSRKISEDSDWKILVESYLKIILVNGAIALGIIIIGYHVIYPYEKKWFHQSLTNDIIFFLLTAMSALPFIWGVLIKRVSSGGIYKRLWEENPFNRGPLLSLRLARILAGLAIIAFLLSKVFYTGVVLAISIFFVFVGMTVFSKKLQEYYTRMESRFYSNLNFRELAKKERENRIHGLMPWDTHFADIKVTAASKMVGKRLKDIQLREKYNANIAIIDRKIEKIYVPTKYEVIFPGDVLTIFGDDEQLAKIKELFDVPLPDKQQKSHDKIDLGKLLVQTGDKYCGKTIEDCHIRELTQGMVIGLERGEKKNLNPTSSERLENGDVLWILGEPKLIRELTDLAPKGTATSE